MMLYPNDTKQARKSLGSKRLILLLSKWKKDFLNSSICSLEIPLEPLVDIYKPEIKLNKSNIERNYLQQT